MKKLLLAPFEVKKALNIKEIEDLVIVSNSISRDPLTSPVFKQFIEERVFNKIMKNQEIWSKNFLKNTNNQILRDFIDKKNIHILNQIEVGSCVKINTSKISPEGLSTNSLAVVVKMLKGNKNIGYIVPLSFDVQTATHKSLILEKNISPYKCTTVLRCEFLTPLLQEHLDHQGLHFQKPFIKKVNNFIVSGNNSIDGIHTGIPNFDPFDIRTTERLYFEDYIEKLSLETRNFLDSGFIEGDDKEDKSNVINMVDYVYTKSINHQEKSKLNIENKKLVTNFKALRNLQNVG